MKRAPLLALTWLLCAACAGRVSSRASEAVNANAPVAPPAAGVTAAPTKVENAGAQRAGRGAEVPAEFGEVDFGNFVYPLVVEGKRVRLSGGEYELPLPEGGGATVNLRDVSYADVTGDGKKEAVVQLVTVWWGASCDGGSYQFYFYSIKNGRPALLWEGASGSAAYGCGLKAFAVRNGRVTLEVFKDCFAESGSREGERKKVEDGRPVFKFDSEKAFTRLLYEFNGRGFELKTREVLPYPHESVSGYTPEISVSDD